ncbi:coiled-coil domain-containing protein 57 isoform X1 [Pogona vitticeps]
MLHTEKELNELLIRKEQELKELQIHQICFQKTTLQATQTQLQEMHKNFDKLKEDFTYNLRVLEERDRELEHYETLITQLKMVENAKQAEVSELRVQVDKLKEELAQERRKQEALQYQYQQKLKEHQLELRHIHSSKDTDINRSREEYENMKQQLERKLQEVEGELALQRQELLIEFDTAMKNREHEFRQKADEMSNEVLSHELKVKLLTKELEALKEAGLKMAESLKVAETTNSELEKEIKCKEWEIKDVAAVKDVRIRDLEKKLDSVHLSWKKEKEILERKHAATDHYAREKDAMLASVKVAHAEEIHKLENQIRELQINNETLEMELHRDEKRHKDHLKEKDTIIEKCEQELKAMKTSWESQVARLSRELVSKDLQIHALQEEEIKLRTQLTTLPQDIERYKQQLSLAAEREEVLEKAKVQIELDWQRRCENVERDQYQKSEALIQSLSTARDQVTAELKEKEQRLHELEILLSAVTQERDHVIQELQKHSHVPTGEKQDAAGITEQAFPSADIKRLQEQNSTLRAVIAEMRREMETLNYQTTSSAHSKMKTQDVDPANSATVSFTPEYVHSLEEEIRQLKKKCWRVDKLCENPSEPPRKLYVSSMKSSNCRKNTQTPYQHCMGSETNGTMHADKVASEFPLKKHDLGVPQVDSIGRHEIQLNPVAKRLQEDSVHLRQPLFGIGAGDGPHRQTGNYARLIQSRLKEAARKICSLSKEKQQLLEMVNRLRAEPGVASKEGYQDSKGSKESHFHTFSGVLSPKELVRETEHHLLALEHLQYQLTTQELQYAQQKRTSGKCHNFEENLRNENLPSNNISSKGADVLCKQVQMESLVKTCPANSPKHEVFKLHQSEQSPKEDPKQFQQGLLSSSGTHSSLEEIWQILEMGSSPSVLSPESNNDQENSHIIYEPERLEDSQEKGQARCKQRASVPPLTIMGNKFNVLSKLRPKKSSCNQSRKPKASQQKSKIRNYNIKDSRVISR